MTAKQFIISRS